MAKNHIVDVTTQLYGLLEPLSTEDRKRAVNAAFVLLGEAEGPLVGAGSAYTGHQRQFEHPSTFGPKAKQWLAQHKLTTDHLEKCFYIQDGKVDVHLNTVVGAGKREQTGNCYLLIGARAFLETDSAAFKDAEAIALCKHIGAYDVNNHAANRKNIGIRIAGSRDDGFVLTGPGLKAAAELIEEIGKAGSV